MSESPNSQETTSQAPTNGLTAFHTRITDLLDDVTETTPDGLAVATAIAAPAQVAPTAPTTLAPASLSSLFAPLPERTPAAPESQAPAPLPAEGAYLPGERLVGAPRRPAAAPPASDLPPFLTQPAASSAANRPGCTCRCGRRMPSRRQLRPMLRLHLTPGIATSSPLAASLSTLRDAATASPSRLGAAVGTRCSARSPSGWSSRPVFFRNGSVALDVGPRPVVEDELRQFAAVLTQFEMKLGVVRTSSERTFQAALATGMTATLESPEGAPVAAAAPAATNTDAASYFVYRGYLRSGHRLRRKENILVIGDINPGAEVISEGDILVWGRLRGVVHAGAGGNRRAIVAALDLEPTPDAHRRRDDDWPRPQAGAAGALLLEKIAAQTRGNCAAGAERNRARRVGCSAPGRAGLLAARGRMSNA
jgi:septum formation inhibitor MinC